MKSPAGSSSAAPRAKVIFTLSLYVSPVQMIPACDQVGTPSGFDALLAPGGVTAALCDALDAAGPYGAGWPSPHVAAGPARLLKTAIVGDGHVRGLACGDDGKSFKWIAFRSAATELGQALLSSPDDRRWWLAGTIKRDEWNGGNAAEMHLEDAALA